MWYPLYSFISGSKYPFHVITNKRVECTMLTGFHSKVSDFKNVFAWSRSCCICCWQTCGCLSSVFCVIFTVKSWNTIILGWNLRSFHDEQDLNNLVLSHHFCLICISHPHLHRFPSFWIFCDFPYIPDPLIPCFCSSLSPV